MRKIVSILILMLLSSFLAASTQASGTINELNSGGDVKIADSDVSLLATSPPSIALIVTSVVNVNNSVGKMLGELGYTYTYYGPEVFPVTYSDYDIIIQAMDGGTTTQISQLASYVGNGGCAILLGGSALSSFVTDVNTYLMGVNTTAYIWKLVGGSPDITTVDTNHPLAAGLPATYDFVNNYATYYMLRILDTVPHVVATNGDGNKTIVTQYLGTGKFTWFINSPAQNYWTDAGDYSYLKTYLGNAVKWATTNVAFIDLTGNPNPVMKMLGELGYTYDYYPAGTYHPGLPFPASYNKYDVVIQAMNGGSDHQISQLASYISNGGCAIILGGSADSGFVTNVNAYLMYVNTISYSWTTVAGSPDMTITDTLHRLASGLPTTIDFVNSGATYYMLRILDPLVETIAVNGDGQKAIVAKGIGLGRFTYFINAPYTGYWTNAGDYGYFKTYLSNALGWSMTGTAALAVRGGDNRVWYRIYSGGVWGSWYPIAAATGDSLGAAMIGNKLHIIARDMSGTTIWHSYVNIATNTFSGWTMISGHPVSAPTLTSNGAVLSLVVRGGDNKVWYRTYIGGVWGSWHPIAAATGDSLGAAMIGNNLHIVARDLSGTTIWHGYVNVATNVFSGWTLISGHPVSAPTLTSNGTALSLVVRGGDNKVWYRTYIGGVWGSWNPIAAATGDSPGATMIGNNLHIIARNMAGTTIWHGYVNVATNAFSGWTLISGHPVSKPTLTS